MFITDQSISVPAFLSQQKDESCGASVSFVGAVRNHHEGKSVRGLYYECYTTMANKQIGLIVDRIKKDFGVHQIRLLHRVGSLQVGDVAIVIEVQSEHREAAFAACRAVLDEVKKTVPIWKKEVYSSGPSEWVLCSHVADGFRRERHLYSQFL